MNSSFINSLKRKKKIDPSELTESKLDRCLSTFDLTTLGIGSTLGLGIYVLAGQVASTKAGPSIILSFAVAAIASLFAGLCYAEFGARVPKAGSAYIYSYITVGEFMAFIIGWNLVLEYLIGTASVARGYSGYIDSLLDSTISSHLKQWMPMEIPHLSSYPDFLAFIITIILSFMLAFGVRESTRFNSVFTCINILIVLYVIICGSFKIDFHNWSLSKEEIDNFSIGSKVVSGDRGTGGFFPFGFSGMMAGAATCFYGFVGFDVIATTGEEAKNPRKSIPIAIASSLFIVFLSYTGVSAIQTLIWPYFDQNTDAPLPYVFGRIGYRIAKWIVSFGALAGLSTSLLGAMFPLPRILYAMATDGLIFQFLGNVHERLKTPILATLISGLLAASLAAIFDVSQLADMMSIGTLLAYSLVAISVLILRTSYHGDGEISNENAESQNGRSPNEEISNERCSDEENSITSNSNNVGLNNRQDVNSENIDSWNIDIAKLDSLDDDRMKEKNEKYFRLLLNLRNQTEPTPFTATLSLHLICFSCISIFLMNMCLILMQDSISNFDPLAIISIFYTVSMFVISIILLSRQPTEGKRSSFQVPWVPTIPLISVAINMYLMMKLSTPTWIRFAIWMIIGFFIYFGYGIRKSTLTVERNEENAPESN